MIARADRTLAEEVRDAGNSDKIEVFSLQSGTAYETLLKTGRLHCDPNFSYPEGREVSGKKLAYEWMANQGCRRASFWPPNILPLWASLKPYTRAARRDDLQLTLQIPRGRLLPHFYDGWCKLLTISEHLKSISWPLYWKPWVNPVIDAKSDGKLLRTDDGAILPSPPEWECRATWNTILDLSHLDSPQLKWDPIIHVSTAWFDVRDLFGVDEIEWDETS